MVIISVRHRLMTHHTIIYEAAHHPTLKTLPEVVRTNMSSLPKWEKHHFAGKMRSLVLSIKYKSTHTHTHTHTAL